MKSFGDLPLVVLSGDHHPGPYADWQRDLAQLGSSRRADYNSWRVTADTGFIWTYFNRYIEILADLKRRNAGY